MPWRSTLGGCPWSGSASAWWLWPQQVPGRAGCVPQSQSQSKKQLSSVATEIREVSRYSRATVGGSEDRVFQVALGFLCVLGGGTATGLFFLFSGSSLPLLAQNPRLVWEVVAEPGEGSQSSWYQRKDARLYPDGGLELVGRAGKLPLPFLLPLPSHASTSIFHSLSASPTLLSESESMFPNGTFPGSPGNLPPSALEEDLLQRWRVESGDNRAISLQGSSGMGRDGF